MKRAVHAEWTKLRTLPSTGWLVLTAALLTIALGAVVAVSVNVSLCPTPTTCGEDTTRLALIGVWIGQVGVIVVAVLAMTSEYSTRTIHATLTADPRRFAVLAGKITVVTAVALTVGALGVLGSLAAARGILPGNGFTPANGYPPLSLGDGPTLRAAAGTVLYFGLVALLGLGAGAILRDTAGALTAVFGLLYLSPLVAGFISNPMWQQRLQKFSPMSAGLAVQVTRDLDAQAIGPWAGLGVLACYAAGALIAGALLLRFRDA